MARRARKTAPSPAAAELSVAEHLATQYEALIERCRDAAARSGEDPVTATHEFRKALRRARSLVRFATPLMEPKTARHLARQLRAVFRATNARRDRDVVRTVLSMLGSCAQPDPAIPALLERVDHPPLQPDTALTWECDFLVATLVPLRAALASAGGWADLERALAASFLEARQSYDRARSDPADDEAFHDFRKRLKELRDATAIVEPLGRAGLLSPRRRLAALCRDVGDATDLILTARYITQLGDQNALPPLARVLRRLALRRQHRVARVLAACAATLDDKPRAFAARLIGALIATAPARDGRESKIARAQERPSSAQRTPRRADRRRKTK